MSKVETVVKTINEKLSLSRRGFMKGMLAVGATASLYGCSKGDDTEEVFISDTSLPASDAFANAKSTYRYGTSAHNCGGRCVIRAQVVDGRIVRFLTDDSKVDYEGNTFEIDGRNSAQAKACARCRGYKGRLYHPGRLKYPLKQTKKRGDMSGFVRMTWEDALTEISTKLKSVTTKYGPEAFHTVYACGNIYSPFQGASYPAGVFASNSNGNVSGLSWALRLLGGAHHMLTTTLSTRMHSSALGIQVTLAQTLTLTMLPTLLIILFFGVLTLFLQLTHLQTLG